MATRLAEAFVDIKANQRPFFRSLTGFKGKLTSAMANIGRSAIVALGPIGAGLGIALGFGKLISSANSFEQAMSSSLAIVSGVTKELRAEMEATAKVVAVDTVFSAQQAAEAYFFLASAGLDVANSIKALPAVAQFAQAGMFDLATATSLLTGSQNALGLTTGTASERLAQMVRVSDVLVKANILGDATVQEFATALTRAAGSVKGMGKDVEEVVSVLVAFAANQRKGTDAATQFDILMRELTARAKENEKAFKKFNIEVFRAGQIRHIADIIGDLESAFAGLGPEARLAALGQLGFAAESQKVINSLVGSSELIRNSDAALRGIGGTTAEVAGKQLPTLTKAWNKTKAIMEDFAISIGKVLLPFLGAMLDLGVSVGKGFIEAFTPVGEIIGFLVNVIKSAIEVLTKFSPQLIKVVFTSLSWAAGMLVAVKALTLLRAGIIAVSLAMAVSPIGVFVIAMAALGGILVTTTDLFGQVDDKVADTEDSIESLNESVSNLSSSLQNASGDMADFGGEAEDNFSKAEKKVEKLVELLAAVREETGKIPSTTEVIRALRKQELREFTVADVETARGKVQKTARRTERETAVARALGIPDAEAERESKEAADKAKREGESAEQLARREGESRERLTKQIRREEEISKAATGEERTRLRAFNKFQDRVEEINRVFADTDPAERQRLINKVGETGLADLERGLATEEKKEPEARARFIGVEQLARTIQESISPKKDPVQEKIKKDGEMTKDNTKITADATVEIAKKISPGLA